MTRQEHDSSNDSFSTDTSFMGNRYWLTFGFTLGFRLKVLSTIKPELSMTSPIIQLQNEKLHSNINMQ